MDQALTASEAVQGYLNARAAQARALGCGTAYTRQSNLGQGMAAAWVTVTVTAGVTQCSCSDAGTGDGGSNRGGSSDCGNQGSRAAGNGANRGSCLLWQWLRTLVTAALVAQGCDRKGPQKDGERRR